MTGRLAAYPKLRFPEESAVGAVHPNETGRDIRRTAPFRAIGGRAFAGEPPEHAAEGPEAAEADRRTNLRYRERGRHEQLLGPGDSPCAKVLMRRLSGCRTKGADEVKLREPDDPSEPGHSQRPAQIAIDVLAHSLGGHVSTLPQGRVVRLGGSHGVRSERHQPSPQRLPDGIRAIRCAKLAEDRAEMKLHRLVTDFQPAGNGLVGKAVGE